MLVQHMENAPIPSLRWRSWLLLSHRGLEQRWAGDCSMGNSWPLLRKCCFNIYIYIYIYINIWRSMGGLTNFMVSYGLMWEYQTLLWGFKRSRMVPIPIGAVFLKACAWNAAYIKGTSNIQKSPKLLAFLASQSLPFIIVQWNILGWMVSMIETYDFPYIFRGGGSKHPWCNWFGVHQSSPDQQTQKRPPRSARSKMVRGPGTLRRNAGVWRAQETTRSRWELW